MTVSFCGHRKIEYGEKLLSNLEKCVLDLAQRGATMFYIGGYGEFDRLAARAVYNIKKRISRYKVYICDPVSKP